MKDKVPGTSDEPLDPQIEFMPRSIHRYRPMGFGVTRAAEGVEINFMITPVEVVSVLLPEELRKQLVSDLTGGVALV